MQITPGLAEATADGDLLFTFSSDRQVQLHSAIVSLWSKGVLRHIIASGCKRDSQDRLLLPMPDAEYEAWTLSLLFMYPPLDGVPPRVTWDSAKHLLLLAHKYDMPGLNCHVLTFLKANPLSAERAWEWLQLACKLEMSEAVRSKCITTITENRHKWPSSLEHGVNMETAQELYNIMAAQEDPKRLREQLNSMKADMTWLADSLAGYLANERRRIAPATLKSMRARLKTVRLSL